jgi:hypothetical protein
LPFTLDRRNVDWIAWKPLQGAKTRQISAANAGTTLAYTSAIAMNLLRSACMLTAAISLVACSTDVAGSAAGTSDESSLVSSSGYQLRYLAMNVGNVAVGCDAYENKLCTPEAAQQIRAYITTWKPDVLLLSEVLDEPQLTRTLFESDVKQNGSESHDLGGPILPNIPALPYAVSCHQSIDRDTGVEDTQLVMDNARASHRHECVVYNTVKFSLVSAGHVFGSNVTDTDKKNCHYDFTARSADLKFLGGKDKNGEDIVITAIAVHPPSSPFPAQVRCRTDEIKSFWSTLAAGKKRVIIGGDWNTQEDDQLQVPSGFYVNYSKGQHFAFATHADEYSAQYIALGKWQYDHTFTNFGTGCTDCGKYYRGESQDLEFGSALGQYDGHPWASQPGLDHRQVLVDLSF